MSRLIDAEELKKRIHCLYSDDLEILEKIDEQPTAFDMEKVLNELKHKESEALRRYSKSKGTDYEFSDKCSWGNWVKAIDIVKRGGRDEKQREVYKRDCGDCL